MAAYAGTPQRKRSKKEVIWMKLEFNETAIDHYNGEKFAGVSTGERSLILRLNKLAEQYPGDVKIVAVNREGMYYKVPWRWISIRPPRKMNLTDEQRAALAERLHSSR